MQYPQMKSVAYHDEPTAHATPYVHEPSSSETDSETAPFTQQHPRIAPFLRRGSVSMSQPPPEHRYTPSEGFAQQPRPPKNPRTTYEAYNLPKEVQQAMNPSTAYSTGYQQQQQGRHEQRQQQPLPSHQAMIPRRESIDNQQTVRTRDYDRFHHTKVTPRNQKIITAEHAPPLVPRMETRPTGSEGLLFPIKLPQQLLPRPAIPKLIPSPKLAERTPDRIAPRQGLPPQ